MGPWNEDTQLARIAAVKRILANPNLSEWAQQHWASVLERLAHDEDRYNARVVTVYAEIEKQKRFVWEQ